MNHPHDDTDPTELDPTGMRALLGSLPDPAPMPADLVERIEAALAEEARRGNGWAVPECPPELRAATPDAPAGVVPLRRRPVWRGLGAAAAVVGVLGLGGLILETASPGGLQAALGVADDLAGGGTVSGAESDGAVGGSDGSGSRGAPARLLAADPDLRVHVLDGGSVISSAELADAARQVPVAPGKAAPAAPADEGVSGAPVATAEGARACATGLGVPRGDAVVVELVVVDGRPAALVVATSPSGARTAWAALRTCAPGDPGALAGPVPVG
ncbi:hypothetical protein [uncultured Phycicoccus sp.]|uniref:hypothetical protein n=1 Tax=uncultured Phycicoccus sp. TaxID=661422 RepID=UPI002634C67C|nr:hypothetical protein [uncultured Phycicoccus sp.]